MDEGKRKCKECGDQLVGRSDKKFCGDGCRNTFNNRLNSDANNLIRNINSTLKRNRRILDECSGGSKVRIQRDQLLSTGFSFSYFTHTQETRQGTVYYFCYEIGYLVLSHEEILIVRNDDQ